ncbi:hypothetical protein KDW_25030 [Dictyobacter vulcani]|uniref:Uncharacterized protein n=1 Tax=Dictyobacter vulcani TaxID=2607529 RepID=A0A5J4KPP3_9CHLR|nr:hypothetical protein KDW_25030 [Dictyobacter vulcani]
MKDEMWIGRCMTDDASLSSSTLQYVIEGEHAVVSFAILLYFELIISWLANRVAVEHLMID